MDGKRRCPFSRLEKETFREIMTKDKYLKIIESKKTDTIFKNEKALAWRAITAEFNQARTVTTETTSKQLKKLWENMKRQVRDDKTIAKQRLHTGGGPYIPDHPDEDNVLGGVLANVNVMPSIKVRNDSDGVGDHDGDDDDESWLHKRNRPNPHPILELNNNDGVGDHDSDDDYESWLQKRNRPNPHPNLELNNNDAEDVIFNLIDHTEEQSTMIELETEVPEKTNKTPVCQSTKAPNIDTVKRQLIINDKNQREMMFKANLDHTKKMNSLKYEMLKSQYEHEKKYYRMIEEDQEMEFQYRRRYNRMLVEEQAIRLEYVKKKYGTASNKSETEHDYCDAVN